MKLLFICMALACAAHAETVTIDAGSAMDSNFTGGAAYLIPQAVLPPGTTDATLRFGASFSYLIPCHDNWPYVVKFRFIEPTVQAAGQRVFSVRINNQVVLDHIDLFAESGYLKEFSRSVIVMGGTEEFALNAGVWRSRLKITFEAQVRTAVVSAIEITPLFQLPAQAFRRLDGQIARSSRR